MMKSTSVYFLLLLTLFNSTLLKASDPITLQGNKTLGSGEIPTIDTLIVQAKQLVNEQSDLVLKGGMKIDGSEYEIKSLTIDEGSNIYIYSKDVFVHEKGAISEGGLQLQRGNLRFAGELEIKAASKSSTNPFIKERRPLEILVNGDTQVRAKSLQIFSGKDNFPIVFQFNSQKAVQNYLAKPKPLIEIEDTIESSSSINIYLVAQPDISYAAGKYPLIQASKIDPNKFSLRFIKMQSGVTQEEEPFFHLQFDDTTVNLVIDKDIVAKKDMF